MRTHGRVLPVGAAALAAALLAACASEPPPPAPLPPGDTAALVIEGAVLAERLCVSCHAIGREGASRNPEAPPLRTLAERYPVTALEEAFAEGVMVGHPAMPEFRLSPTQIDALVAYLQTIQERRAG